MAEDLFGQALYNFWKKDRTPVYFSYLGHRIARSVKRYFRSPDKFTNLEKELISLAHGRILDVGCATGYYIPSLMEHGKVEAVDVSPNAIKVAHNKGLSNCYCVDIYRFQPKHKFDTITLLENNLGLGGSIEKVRELLIILSDFLKPEGQILLHQQETDDSWHKSEITIEYKGRRQIISWLHISSWEIEGICNMLDLRFEILKKGKNHLYLARITKYRV
jgi:2-polyprenyl-3-methyl-5-hydroxy-6-metoxy-1,4-benzoquinol methylase